MSPEAKRWRELRKRIERMRIRPLGPIAAPSSLPAVPIKART